MTHISVSKLITNGSDNGLPPGWRQAIILTTAGILLICPSGTKIHWNINLNSYIFIQENAFEYVVCGEMSAILSRHQCAKTATLSILCLNVPRSFLHAARPRTARICIYVSNTGMYEVYHTLNSKLGPLIWWLRWVLHRKTAVFQRVICEAHDEETIRHTIMIFVNMITWVPCTNMVGLNYLSIPKLQRLQRCWNLRRVSNFIPHFTRRVVTYPFWD